MMPGPLSRFCSWASGRHAPSGGPGGGGGAAGGPFAASATSVYFCEEYVHPPLRSEIICTSLDPLPTYTS